MPLQDQKSKLPTSTYFQYDGQNGAEGKTTQMMRMGVRTKNWAAVLLIPICVSCRQSQPVQTSTSAPINEGPTLRMPGRATWAQAELDSRAQKTDAERDASYKQFAKELPHSPEFLTLYAIFVSDSLHDIPRAEKLYQQALAEPTAGGFTISNYGNFILEYLKDKKKAEALYKRALAKSPNDDTSMAFYGLFLFENGKPDEAQNLIDQAKRYGYSHNQRILVRVDFCRFANGKKEEQGVALYRLRTNMINHFRAQNWDFSPNIKLAMKANHPESAWLERLAAVCSDRADISTLKPWSAWQEAVRIPSNGTRSQSPDSKIVNEDSE
ncbi:MAG: tetratricopeptide repeat protein [Armatimonadota bacterium]